MLVLAVAVAVLAFFTVAASFWFLWKANKVLMERHARRDEPTEMDSRIPRSRGSEERVYREHISVGVEAVQDILE